MIESTAEPRFRLLRTVKLGTFHFGSAAADLMVTAVWNRIMIVDLGVPAWPVALLSAVRYLLAPLSLWAGHRSDHRPLLGRRRISYIWLGRALMLISLPLLPVSTAMLAEQPGSAGGWSLTLVSFVLFGSGTLISGSPFLALVHDSVPYARRGQAISIVQFMLVASFAVLPLTFARLLPSYEPEAFSSLVGLVVIGAGLVWFGSVWREERVPVERAPGAAPDLRQVFSALWSDRRSRRYALFLGVSAVFAFMQDAVLEPFGGDVFGLSVGETTRFNAYWGSGVLLAMLLTMWLTRRWRPERQVHATRWGLLLLALPLLGLGAASAAQSFSPIRPLLFLFGLGFGVFTVGGVSLLMAMSKEGRAGAYLGLWSVIQLGGRGTGIAAGGLLRDLGLSLTGGFAGAYASVFWIEGLGALACIWLLSRVDVLGFSGERGQVGRAEALAAAD
ncbi:MAG: BCD family MFS transporter [Anaerolineales bacterium]